MLPLEIVTIGSATLDVLMKGESFSVAKSGEQLMVCEILGGKMDVEEGVLVSGGAATNTAVSFSRQGFTTGCLSEIGVDIPAQVVWDDLDREGVRTNLLISERNERTAISVVLIAGDGSRSAMTYRGASRQMMPQDLALERLRGVKAIHLSSVGSVEVILKVMEWCKRERVLLSWNPSKTEAEEMLLRREVDEIGAELLFLNEIEWTAVEKVKEKIVRMVKKVVITRGKEGGEIIIEGQEHKYLAGSVKKVVDETGAGDAFASGLVGGLVRGKSAEEALEFAIANATSVCEYMGAKEGLLHRE